MQHTLIKQAGTGLGGLILLAACAGSAAAAGPDVAAPLQLAPLPALTTIAVAGAEPARAANPAAQAPLDFGRPADLGKLEQSRGGTDTTTNNMHLDGVVSGNSANNVVTGNNVIDAGSFANMAGIPVVIQNSGANVLIQNATIVNLQFK